MARDAISIILVFIDHRYQWASDIFADVGALLVWGTVVNVSAIVLGSVGGVVVPHTSEGIRRWVLQGLGLGIVVLGISMGIKSDNFLLVIMSLVGGCLIGEAPELELRLTRPLA